MLNYYILERIKENPDTSIDLGDLLAGAITSHETLKKNNKIQGTMPPGLLPRTQGKAKCILCGMDEKR